MPARKSIVFNLTVITFTMMCLMAVNFYLFAEYPANITMRYSMGWPFVMKTYATAPNTPGGTPFEPFLAAANFLSGWTIILLVLLVCEKVKSKEETPNRRRWFQFRLSTALTAVLLAGVMLALQMHVTHTLVDDRRYPHEIEQRGFPFVCWTKRTAIDKTSISPNVMEMRPNGRSGNWVHQSAAKGYIDQRALFNDVLLSLSVIALSAFCVESLARRREDASPHSIQPRLEAST